MAAVAAGDRRVLVFRGRVHLYEGNSAAAVTHGVRTAAAAGCAVAVLTNAAGGLRAHYRVGGPVLISDHLNLTGESPVAGTEWGTDRFVNLVDAYSPRLRALAAEVDPEVPEGVYAGLRGPHFETPAEIEMLRTMGADLVGMSTVLECIAARHCGLDVLGVSPRDQPCGGDDRRGSQPSGGTRSGCRFRRTGGPAAARRDRPSLTGCPDRCRHRWHDPSVSFTAV